MIQFHELVCFKLGGSISTQLNPKGHGHPAYSPPDLCGNSETKEASRCTKEAASGCVCIFSNHIDIHNSIYSILMYYIYIFIAYVCNILY